MTLRNNWPTAVAVTMVALCALSGCGGSTPSAASGGAVPPSSAAAAASSQSGPAAKIDPCTLITKDEADAAFGLTFDAPATTTRATTTTCTYKLSGGGSSLSIGVNPASSRAALDGMRKIYGATATDVPGVGDAAMVFSRIYSVIKGSTLVTIATGDGPGIISDEKLLGLVKTAVSRV